MPVPPLKPHWYLTNNGSTCIMCGLVEANAIHLPDVPSRLYLGDYQLRAHQDRLLRGRPYGSR